MSSGPLTEKSPPRRYLPQPAHGAPLSVPKPEIVDVVNMDTGDCQTVAQVFGTDPVALMRLRDTVLSRIQDEEPLFRCARCYTPVQIARHFQSRLFFFKHRHEDGNCPAITRGELSQDEINALKYNGAKESRRHREMKDAIAKCLAVDDQFSNIEIEATWHGSLPRQWRRPDVRAIFRGLPIAFEIQLSTTFQEVIVERRRFYQKQGGMLVWVFAEFNADRRRTTEDDIFYNNNLNAFVVNNQTVEQSMRDNRFVVECCWSKPKSGGGISGLFRRLVPFGDLTLEVSTQRAFFFDFEKHRAALTTKENADQEELRAEIETWWATRKEELESDKWPLFSSRLRRLGVIAPRTLRDLDQHLITALYSAKHGRPFGDRRKRLIEVAHAIAGSHRDCLIWFIHAVRHYGREVSMKREGNQGAWDKKHADCVKLYRQCPEAFAPPSHMWSVVEFLFPELMPLPALP